MIPGVPSHSEYSMTFSFQFAGSVGSSSNLHTCAAWVSLLWERRTPVGVTCACERGCEKVNGAEPGAEQGLLRVINGQGWICSVLEAGCFSDHLLFIAV